MIEQERIQQGLCRRCEAAGKSLIHGLCRICFNGADAFEWASTYYRQEAALGLFLAACRGTGGPGEPTPLDCLDMLLREVRQNAPAELTAGAQEAQETLERLARELRAAVAKAEGGEEGDPYTPEMLADLSAPDPGPFPACAACGDAGEWVDAEDGAREACAECGEAEEDEES